MFFVELFSFNYNTFQAVSTVTASTSLLILNTNFGTVMFVLYLSVLPFLFIFFNRDEF